MPNIVPFGKYKNQPIEVLAQDSAYCEWLSGQGWVAERYPELHTLIINNFADPTETPEHNALQLCFLDQPLRLKLSNYLACFYKPLAHSFLEDTYQVFIASCGMPLFEQRGIDIQWGCSIWIPEYKVEPLWDRETKTYTKIQSFSWREVPLDIIVECKPSLGDDYPAVLRFMHKFQGYKAVIVQDYTQRGGTIEQVQQFFQVSRVLLLDLVSLQAMPPVPIITKEDLPDAALYYNK